MAGLPPPFHLALVRFLGATSVMLEHWRTQSAQCPSRNQPSTCNAPDMLLTECWRVDCLVQCCQEVCGMISVS